MHAYEDHHAAHGEHAEHAHQYDVIFYLFNAIVIGTVIVHVTTYVHWPSEPFWMHLNLNMAAPQTCARTFTKPGFRLY